MKRLVIGVLVFFASSLALGVLGINSVISLVLSLAVAFFVASRLPADSAAGAAKTEGFVSDFKHDNIAINTQTGKLWVRGHDGRSAVLDKADILRWNLAFTSVGVHHINNRIEIHVRDLNRPMWSIPFNRFNDAWRWNNGKNYAEAEEWQSRLTTWLHS